MSETLWDDEDDDDEDVVDVEGTVEESSKEESDLPTPDNLNSVVKPVENVEEVVQVYEQFESLKKELLDTKKDLTEIGDGVHVNKSGWRKIATAFNLSTETVNIERTIDDGIIRYRVSARAVAPNGKASTASGLAASNESNFMESLKEGGDWHTEDDDVFKVDGKYRRLKPPEAVSEHNVMTLAETRAKNRAISDLVGGGEVSAEEMAARKKEEILE